MDSVDFLLSPLKNMYGFGEKNIRLYEKLLFSKKVIDFDKELRILDLLYHKPEKILFRKKDANLSIVENDDLIITRVRVSSNEKPLRKFQPHRIVCYNESGFITLIYFKMFDYMNNIFNEGDEIVISGKVERFNNELQMTHPDYVFNLTKQGEDMILKIPDYEQVYPLTAGLSNKVLRQNIHNILNKVKEIPEWLPYNFLFEKGWRSWRDSLFELHNAKNNNALSLNSPYTERLVFDELLANQISLGIIREKIKTNTEKTELNNKNKELKNTILKILPFQLTDDQKKVITEIENNIYSKNRMLRLLQGDVGSGKTIVAFLTMMSFIENKKQTALMVPTSILATQHYESIKKLLSKSNEIELVDCNEIKEKQEKEKQENNDKKYKIRVALLTGKIKGKKRTQILKLLEDGEIDILIGTHAIFQEKVNFKNLSYVVIDEQHRFGVSQRLNLIEKGEDIDVLIMTATPIPRTLSLTIYGDMEVSSIKQKPQNRKEIITTSLQKERFDDLVIRIKEKIKQNEKVYWICPLIEESENLPATPLFQRYEDLKKFFKEEEVGFIHGKMSEDEKDKIMNDFSDKNGLAKILVSTTVVEVGVDVPDATIIVIDNPERFGLSQMHQLRGRVGRGDKQSYCILFYENLTKNLKTRLNIMKNSSDGFYIAEEDLKLRGAGEVLGARQSGFQEYLIADLSIHYELLAEASRMARNIVNDKNLLKSEEIQVLLKFFGYNKIFNRDIFN